MDEKKVREAIEYLKILKKENIECGYFTTVKLSETAIKALEKQLPKKVETKVEYKTFDGDFIYFKGFCPNCGFIVDSSRNNSCHSCGQRLDWSE